MRRCQAQETPRTAPSAVLDTAMTPQKQRIGELIRELERLEPGRDWKAHCREFVGVPPERMSVEIAAHLIRELTDRVEELGGE